MDGLLEDVPSKACCGGEAGHQGLGHGHERGHTLAPHSHSHDHAGVGEHADAAGAGAEVEDCCGGDYCTHTTVQHHDHIGFLRGGQLFCHVGGKEHQHALEHMDDAAAAGLPCNVLPALDGHVHGPNCGHELVPHGDHVDYLVNGRLHHVVEMTCCNRGCRTAATGPMIVDHGKVQVLVHKRFNSEDGLVDEASEPEDEATEGLLNEPLLGTGSEVEVVSDASPASGDVTSKIHAAGICCPSEVPIIHRTLARLSGIHSVDVNVVLKTVTVRHDAAVAPAGVVVDALNGARLQASLISGNRDEARRRTCSEQLPPWYLLLSGFCVLLSFAHYSAAVPPWFVYFGLVSVGLGALPVLLKAAAALRSCFVDINVLMLFAAGGAIALADYNEAGAIVFLFSIAEWLEAQAMKRAQLAVEELVDLKQETAVLARTGLEVPSDKVTVGTHVLVLPGERFPVDGVISRSRTEVDESMLTGESRLIHKKRLDKVMSGTVNAGRSAVEVEATSVSENSSAAVMARLVEQASGERSKTEQFIDVFAKWYTPTVILAAVLVAAVPAAMHHERAPYFLYLALVLLVTACPCALVISTPVAAVCGLARSAHEGILFKGGQFLESMASLRVITLDKTGTLTEGRFRVKSVTCWPDSGISEQALLYYAATIEAQSPHPLAPAVVAFAAAQGVSPSSQVSAVFNLEGMGATGVVDGEHEVYVGNHRLVEERGAASARTAELAAQQQDTVCWVLVGGRLAGCIELTDHIRPHAKTAVAALQGLGVETVMLTGDGAAVAAAVAAAVGIPSVDVHADMLPEQKLEVVRRRKVQHGNLAHVGDGINDAPALAAADIGIAMGVAGSAAAVEAANVALFTTDLRKLALAIRLARVTRRKIQVNIAFSLAVKAVVLAATLAGYAYLWVAILADVGTSLLVVLNSCQILTWGRPLLRKPKCEYGLGLEEQAHAHKHSAGGGCCGPKADSHAHKHSAGGGCCGPKAEAHAHSSGGGCCGPKAEQQPHDHSHSTAGGCCAPKPDSHAHKHSAGGGCCGPKPQAHAPSHSKGGGCCGPKPEAHAHSNGGGCCGPAAEKQPHDHSHSSAGGCCAPKAQAHAHALSTEGGCYGPKAEKQPHDHSHSHGGGCCGPKPQADAQAQAAGGGWGGFKPHDHAHIHPTGGECCAAKAERQPQAAAGGCQTPSQAIQACSSRKPASPEHIQPPDDCYEPKAKAKGGSPKLPADHNSGCSSSHPAAPAETQPLISPTHGKPKPKGCCGNKKHS